ncbi:SpoIIE family protein phosphatase [Microscilla marina]|uniref:Serine/threonine protein kinases n=1 Tax=Microscilla marina ATCC 23134 TaxID=313606 RepID=A1ZU10_MICM2|nr:SpoIIE family protein phosphatase [Microscilla marina]EAY26123.1 serine/threonine protein kinases [Microscilla marina ATCC 23134]
MNKALHCVLLVLLIIDTVQGQTTRTKAGKPLIEVYNTKTYGGDRQVWAIAQDKRGVMYFGHNKGLIEYDGVSWRKIATPHNKRVRSLAVDKQGTVYVASVGDFGYLKPDSRGFLQYQSLLPELPKNSRDFGDVWRVSIVKNKVNFITFPHLYCFQNKKLLRIYHSPKPYRFHYSFNIAGMLYQPRQANGITTYDADSLKTIAGAANIGESRVFAMLPYPGQKILLCEATTKFWLYDTNTQQAKRFRSDLDNTWEKQAIYCGVNLPNGLFAFGSRLRGVIIMNRQGKVIDLIDKTKGLPDNTVWSLYYEPNTQNLWVGTDQGIARIDVSSPLEQFDDIHGLEGSIDDILRFKNTLYVSSGVGVFRLKNNRFQRIKGIKRQTWGLWSYQAPNVKEEHLMISNNLGIYTLKDTIAQLILPEKSVFRTHTDHTNPRRMYIGFIDGLGSVVYKNRQWQIEVERYEGLTEPVRQVLQDKQNRVWVSTRYKGVGLLEGKKITMFDSTAGLPPGRVNIVFQGGQLYHLTQKGEYVFDEAKRRFHKSHVLSKPLGDTPLSFLSFDSTQAYCIAKQLPKKQYVPYVKRGQHYRADTSVFKPIYDKMLDRVEVETNGIFWLSSDEGFFRYDAKAPFLLQKKFTTLIRRVQAHPDSLLYAGYQPPPSPTLSYSHNSLTFAYAALYFGFAHKNQYSYQLVGYDKEWSEWSSDNKKGYTNLNEGKYTFRVKSRNLYGIESNIATYSFIILPPWYRTWWAFVVYVLLLLVIIAGSIRWYTARLQRQKVMLEKKVQRRTREILKQKEEIQAQNEELWQQSEEIASQRDAIEEARDALNLKNLHMKQSIKSAETIQSAILPLIEDLQQALHEHFVIFMPRDIVSGDFYYLETVGNKTIVAAIDCTGHGVPGAFMSLIGYTLLNDIVNVQQKTNPGNILETLRVELKVALKQEKTGRHNGMDVAMVTLEHLPEAQVKVLFAGARRPLWYIEPNHPEVQQISGSKISVGFNYEHKRTIATHELLLATGTKLYLGSDGFADQNNDCRQKFGSVQLIKLLASTSHLPLTKQRHCLEKVLKEFMAGTEQRDDILLMGIKL